MPVYCFFDEDFDKRLGCHVDPSRTAIMENPFRCQHANPHVSGGCIYTRDEIEREKPEIKDLRQRIDHLCDSVTATVNIIKYYTVKKHFGVKGMTNSLDKDDFRLMKDQRLFKVDHLFDGSETVLPALLDKNGQPTPAFDMILDRLAECSELEKEQAREIGRREGLMAGINLMNQKVQHPELNLQEEIYKVQYPDYSDKYCGPRLMNLQYGKDEDEKGVALMKLRQLWDATARQNARQNQNKEER